MSTETKPVFWRGTLRKVDDFGDTITNEFIDGRANVGTSWGIFSPRSWLHYGCGRLGTGYGQRYERQPGGEFMKVEG